MGHDLVDGNLRYFMEYYPYSLLTLMKKKKEPFRPKDIAFLGYSIANALSYLHSHGLEALKLFLIL
jgi:serine/threonine protein kinase